MAMRMLIVAALAAGLNGAGSLVAGAGLDPAAVAGGANPCDETKTSTPCGNATGKTCTKNYLVYGPTPEGMKPDAFQLALTSTPCATTNSSCLKGNMTVKNNDEFCTK